MNDDYFILIDCFLNNIMSNQLEHDDDLFKIINIKNLSKGFIIIRKNLDLLKMYIIFTDHCFYLH